MTAPVSAEARRLLTVPTVARLNSDGTPRLADGQIAQLVLRHLRSHPRHQFSPYDLAKVIRRSHGTIRKRLFQLADEGQVILTQDRPAKFQIHPHSPSHQGRRPASRPQPLPQTAAVTSLPDWRK